MKQYMIPFIRLIIILALICTGCASSGGIRINTTSITLPDQVPESFHFNIRNRGFREMITAINTKRLSGAQRLEVTILKGLATTSNKDDVPLIFDRIWDTEDVVKDIVRSSGIDPQYYRPMAEMYYLLVSADTPSWRENTAATIKQGPLRDIKAEDLTGYALHFYTYALLKTGNFDKAWPLLQRLSDFTSPETYRQDLLIALQLSCHAQDGSFSAKILNALCAHSLNHHLKLPDTQIRDALLLIKKTDTVEGVSKKVLPFIKQNPELQDYGFVKLLETSTKIKKKVPATVKKQPGLKKLKLKKPWAQVNIEVISAGSSKEKVDIKLAEIAPRLKKTLPYTEYKLLDTRKFTLKEGEKGKMAIADDYVLTVMPDRIFTDRVKLDISLYKKGKNVYNTGIECSNGDESYIGGPSLGEAKILIRLLAWIKTK